MTDKSVLGDLPVGVSSILFLRDGWPDAVVCKVVMTTGCVGIGIVRSPGLTPEQADTAAMLDAIDHVSLNLPDYTEVHKHAAKMLEAAKARIVK